MTRTKRMTAAVLTLVLLLNFAVFYNIGAYSVTEGIYLFLSRKMPKIIAYSEKEGTSLYRDFKFSDKINSREDLI